MPLTPADVHNVAFTKPPIGTRGVDADEVDTFLDQVEQELARLIEENHQLRTQVERAGRGASADRGDGPRLAAELANVRVQLHRVERDKAAAEQAVDTLRADLEQARTPDTPVVAGDGEQRAQRVLMAAQRTADDHLADARREAEQLLSDARATAQQVTENAQTAADTLERDARRHHQEAMGALDAKRTAAQKTIEDLRQFGREYRTQLTAHLDRQLRDLDTQRQELETTMGEQSGDSRYGGDSNALAGPRSGPE